MKNYLTILFLLFFIGEVSAYEIVSLQQPNSYYPNYRKRPNYNLPWLSRRNNQGFLTGYSTPISKDVYKNMGSDFWDKEFTKTPSRIKPTTELFSISPTNGGSTYNRGRLKDGIDGISSSAGVRIIYD